MRTPQALALTALVAAAVALHAAPSRACGGLLQPETGSVTQSGQVALLVVDQGQTNVVLTLDVPDAKNAFGVLVPVPSEPTIDAQPVSSAALDALDQRTRPVVGVADDGGEDAGFFGCGGAPLKAGAANDRGVVVGAAVDVGPVTAQWLSGASGAAVSDWLDAEGFALPDGAQALIDAYVAQGLSFLAFTRNDAAAGAARVGVHFTLDGEHPAYALQMTKLGAGAQMAFTILVATADADGVGPDTPYKAITVAELDQDLVASDYQQAVAKGVKGVGGKGFVVETKALASDLFGDGVLGDLVPAGLTITRMSAVLDPNDLDADVSFTSKAPASLAAPVGLAGAFTSGPSSSGTPSRAFGDALLLAALALALAAAGRRSDEVLARA